MLIPVLMFSLDSDQGKVKYSPLYGRGSKVTILVGRIFNQKCCQSPFSIRNVANRKIVQKKPSWDTFLLEIFHVNQKMHFFGGPTLTFLMASSMTLLPREGQNLLHSRFSCMLIPFLMFPLDSDQGKVKYSPLYGRGSKVTILVGRIFNQKCCQSPFSIRNVAIRKIVQKKPSWDTFLLEIFHVKQKMHFFGGPTLPPSGPVL